MVIERTILHCGIYSTMVITRTILQWGGIFYTMATLRTILQS